MTPEGKAFERWESARPALTLREEGVVPWTRVPRCGNRYEASEGSGWTDWDGGVCSALTTTA